MSKLGYTLLSVLSSIAVLSQARNLPRQDVAESTTNITALIDAWGALLQNPPPPPPPLSLNALGAPESPWADTEDDFTLTISAYHTPDASKKRMISFLDHFRTFFIEEYDHAYKQSAEKNPIFPGGQLQFPDSKTGSSMTLLPLDPDPETGEVGKPIKFSHVMALGLLTTRWVYQFGDNERIPSAGTKLDKLVSKVGVKEVTIGVGTLTAGVEPSVAAPVGTS